MNRPHRFGARCSNAACVDGKIIVKLPSGTVTTTCGVCYGFGCGRGGEQLEARDPMRSNPPRRAKRAKSAQIVPRRPHSCRRPRTTSARKNNPPRTVEVRQFGGKKGHLVGCDVFALEYANAGSRSHAAYRHDFDSKGIELWALADGSLMMRHPDYRLWDDFNVSDTE